MFEIINPILLLSSKKDEKKIMKDQFKTKHFYNLIGYKNVLSCMKNV